MKPGHLPIVVVACSLVAACGADGTPDAEAPDGAISGTVLVFAAASLTDAFADIERSFEEHHPAADVQLNLAGSASLREQILDGAPADVVASADVATLQPLIDAEAIEEGYEFFATNGLTIAVPSGNPGSVEGVTSFEDGSLLLGACAPGVPCGDLATEVFAAAGVRPALDTEEPNVRAVLTKVSAGELDAGIVYTTDVLAESDTVDSIEIPPDVNVSSAYPIAIVRDSPNTVGGVAFVEFVLSDEGRELLAGRGFGSP
jgi:molybdate transport system substrate-binding protein